MPSATRTVRNQFTRQIVQRVAWALVKVWEALNRDAHRDSSEIVTECFGGIRKSGLIGLARDARDEGGQPLNAEHNGVARMFALLCTPDGVSRLPAAFCETVTLLAQEIERIRQLAKVELDPKLRSELDITFQTLKRHLATLLETAFLTELPFGPKMISLDPLTVERLSGVLYERWEVTRTAAQAPHFERWINRDLGMSLGFSLFDSVRAQHWKRAEIGLEGLARHLDRPQQFLRRGLTRNIGFGVDQIMQVALGFREASFKAPAGSELRKLRSNAALVEWITAVNVLRTGVLVDLASN